MRLTSYFLALQSAQFMPAQEHSTRATVPDAAANLVKAHNNWGPKASTPGTSAVLKESGRSGTIIRFRLYVEGAPKDTIYSLVAWPVTQKSPSKSMEGVTLDASGLAICAGTPGTCGGDKPNDPIDLIFQPVPGEPVRVGLISTDGAIKVLVKTVPIPLRGEDRGCAVDAVLLTPGSELVLIEGSGFPAGPRSPWTPNQKGSATVKKSKWMRRGIIRVLCSHTSRAWREAF